MDNVLSIALACVITFVFGIVVGVRAEESIVNNHCEKYSQFGTNEYKLTCIKK